MPDIIVGLTEAESLDLTDGYAIENRGDASGGALVWISPDSDPIGTGTATGTFSGANGVYDIKVNFFNEDDGIATWTLRVNGTPVGSFEGIGGSGLGTPDSETFTVALEDGDTLAITADLDGGERGRFDSLEIRQIGAISVGENEAEDLILSNYSVESVSGASGGQVVVLPLAPANPTGTVGGEFNGAAGAYDITVTYLNEEDGVGNYELLVNGEVVGSWSGTGGGIGFGVADTERFSVSLDAGDTVEVRGTRGDGERGRIDRIDVEPAKMIGAGVTEAEDLALSNYEVETRSGASGGEVIKIVNTGTGSASGLFDGLSGTYSMTVNYFDENDGASPFTVFVNGVAQGTWTTPGPGSGAGTPESETLQIEVNTGDTITIEGTRNGNEFARIDSIELTAINTAPAATPDTATVDEDGAVNVNVLANDSDVDPVTLTAIAGTPVVAGDTVTVANATVTVGENGLLTITPDAEYSGEVSFGYTVSDGTFESDSTVTVTVNAVNDVPVAVTDTASVLEDGSVNVDVLANDTDVEGDTLTVTAIAGTSVAPGNSVSVDNATVTLETDGTLTVTPDADYAGEVVFGYTVSDGTASAQATVAVTVGSVNDGLVAVADTAATTEDASVNVNVLANDIDPDGDPLTVTEIAGTPVAAGDTVDVGTAQVTLQENGTLTVAPDANFSGDIAFTYTVSDGGVTGQGNVTVAVAPVNDAPVVADDTASTNEDSSVSVNVLANDSDAEGATLTVTAVAGRAIAAGDTVDVGPAQVTLEADGTLTVVPDPNFNGDVSFGYTASDGSTTATGTVNVTVASVNDAPLAADDTAGTSEDAPVSIDVLANDTDPDGEALTVTAVAGRAIAPGGSVDVGDAEVTLGADGRLTLAPDTGFDGNITFDYTASDGTASSTASVSVDVEGVIADPTDGDDTITGTAGDNAFSGGGGNDEMFGLGGDDILFGGDGNDLVAGGGGRDLVNGGDGDDDLRGGVGIDTLIGGEGNDRLRVGGDGDFGFGGDGDDFLQGAAGDDTLFGEDGNDVIYGGTGVDILDGGEGDDELRAGSSGDVLDGGEGMDTLLSQSGDDIAYGGGGDDLVNGAAGDDTLFGDAGNDEMNGGSGDDILDGGLGDDILRGQGGNDTFVFDADEGGSDTVIGYRAGETILLRDFGYANAEAAAGDFSQSGNDVVFQNGDNTVTFKNTSLFSLFDGIEVEDSGAGTASVDIARVDDGPTIEEMFDASLLDDDASLF